MPTTLLRASYRPGQYLAFLGRFSRDKGAHVAIKVAEAAGMPLRIAAKIPRDNRRYFIEQIEPHLDGRHVQLVGEVDDRNKQGFLDGAAALLFPIDWPEPFGLVMIEAMACGTPVIAFRAGSVPEIIQDGVTGFVVDNEEEAVRAVKLAANLDRREIRRIFELRFAARRMADDYLRLYQKLMRRALTHEEVVPQATSSEPIDLNFG
jgi:glycosyltransferase involved in cell wall biosynthesis